MWFWNVVNCLWFCYLIWFNMFCFQLYLLNSYFIFFGIHSYSNKMETNNHYLFEMIIYLLSFYCILTNDCKYFRTIIKSQHINCSLVISGMSIINTLFFWSMWLILYNFWNLPNKIYYFKLLLYLFILLN